ncbi:MAG: hypothetical protein JWO34_2422, partial [Arthrobacter sp.]|nr:hypothetical protein [Arthrobacter sp.]
NLKPAVKTRPHHGVAGPAKQPIHKINWYQQTWHTIEFSNNRHIRILAETIQLTFIEFLLFRFSSLRYLNLISFISTLQIRAFLPKFAFWTESAQQNNKQRSFSASRTGRVEEQDYRFSFFLGVCRHSAAATQKTLHAPPLLCKSAGEERAGGVPAGPKTRRLPLLPGSSSRGEAASTVRAAAGLAR